MEFLLRLMIGLHLSLSPGDPVDALEYIFHSHPGLLLIVMVPETLDEG